MNEKDREEFVIMKNEITHIKKDVEEIKSLIKDHMDWEALKYNELRNVYVSKEQFLPVKSIVYGLVSIVLTAVAGALIYLVVK
jgi:hypothetical protein